jgi:hypothetical protein
MPAKLQKKQKTVLLLAEKIMFVSFLWPKNELHEGRRVYFGAEEVRLNRHLPAQPHLPSDRGSAPFRWAPEPESGPRYRSMGFDFRLFQKVDVSGWPLSSDILIPRDASSAAGS